MAEGGQSVRPRAGRTTTADDDLLTRVVGRLPQTPALISAAAVYALIGLVLPFAIHAGVAQFVSFNVIGVLFGWASSLAWLFPMVEARIRRNLLNWTSELRLLSAQEFEWLVGEVLRREGWNVEETGRVGEPDGNVDLKIRKNGHEMLVQCKRWQSWPVDVDEIRKFAGALFRERRARVGGMFVTLSGFTPSAVSEATEADIQLVDGRELARRMEAVRDAEPCPVCGTPMLVSRSVHGWWLRCPRYADGCYGKRDLSPDAGRAIELLTLAG